MQHAACSLNNQDNDVQYPLTCLVEQLKEPSLQKQFHPFVEPFIINSYNSSKCTYIQMTMLWDLFKNQPVPVPEPEQ
jgi:hypothetical protein